MTSTSRMCSACSRPLPLGAATCPACGRTTAWYRAGAWLRARTTPCHVVAPLLTVLAALMARASTTAFHEMTTGIFVLAAAVLLGAGEIVVALGEGGR